MAKGPYFLVDGGYHKWLCMICGDNLSTNPMVFHWNEQVESVRKGVERVKGVVKRRFRFFMLPIMLQNCEVIDYLFCFACALHNWRLSVDGLENFWDDADHWRTSKHESADSLGENGTGPGLFYSKGNKKVDVKDNDDWSTSGTAHFGAARMVHEENTTTKGDNVNVAEVDDDFYTFRQKLIDHYAYVSTASNPDHKLQKKLVFRSFSKEYREWWVANNNNKE